MPILYWGPGNGPAGGAAAGLGWGDPGWGSCCAMGKALVPWGPDGWHHCALPVSQFHCVLQHDFARCLVHTRAVPPSQHWTLLQNKIKKYHHWISLIVLVQIKFPAGGRNLKALCNAELFHMFETKMQTKWIRVYKMSLYVVHSTHSIWLIKMHTC